MESQENEKHPVKAGQIYVVATPIGNLSDISQRARDVLHGCDIIACEDTRVTMRLLQHLGVDKKLVAYHDHNEAQMAEQLVSAVVSGKALAIVSDAGTPCISDPGFRLVREARRRSVPVIPIPGACAMITALSASGLPSDRFFYAGFLPPKSAARERFLNENKNAPYTIILYESCHRIEKFMAEMLSILGEKRVVCMAKELTKFYETFLVGTLGEVSGRFKNMSHKGEFVVIIAPEDFVL